MQRGALAALLAALRLGGLAALCVGVGAGLGVAGCSVAIRLDRERSRREHGRY